jgi:Type III restriction enzyme, res subunit/Helicase conserved C-terminal domain
MNYVLPNRKGFSDFVTRLFLKYREKDTEPESKTRELFSYQKIVREYLLMETPYRGLLLYHGLGSGKTCSSIAVAESLLSTKKIYVLLPASLQANYRTEIRKCGDPIYAYEQYWEPRALKEDRTEPHNLSISDTFLDKNRKYYVTIQGRAPNFSTLSKPDQDTIKKQIDDILDQRFSFINYNGINTRNVDSILPPDQNTQFDDCVVIIDEAHNLIGNVVNDREAKRKLYDRIYHAKRCKVVALSGTPIINRPNEIAVLLNLLRGPIERVTIPTKNAVSWDEGMMTSFLKKLPDVDTIEYNSVKRSILLTRNPADFVSVYNDKGDRIAVKYEKDESYIPDIRDWAYSWRVKFESEFGGTEFVDKDKLVVEELECLPSKYEDFVALFLDGLTFKNGLLFQRRIQGLVSYFRGADEKLLPKRIDEDKTLQKIPFSNEQFLRYLEIRWDEIQKESKKGRRPDMNDDFSSFRMLSRLACNYAIPPELKVSNPDNETEDTVPKKSDILDKLRANPEKYFSDKALATFSPKMLQILKDIKKNMDNKIINQFIYSQYLSLEGLGVFSAILEHHGFQPYKIVKKAGVWEEDASMKPGVPAFAFYSGEVSEEERNIYLEIFNESYSDTFPQSLKDTIKEKRLCVMMASAAGAEGISLMNTRNVYIMEPYWNPARIDQVIGRAIRINSHKNLPEEDRTVRVQMYMSVFSPEQSITAEGPNIVSIRRNDMVLKRYEGDTPQETFMTSDEFLYETAFEKTRVIKQVSHLLKQAAIDCEIHRKLHAKEKPVIQCMRFDTTYTPDELGYKPATIAEERDTLYMKNVTRRTRRLQKVQVKGILIILDPDTNEVFDAPIFEDTQRLLKIGERETNRIRFFTLAN